jgi:hypothetical protein
MRYRHTIPLLFAAAASAAAQPTAAPLAASSVLSSSDLRADLATLRKTYLALHPGLYRYNTPVELAARFDSVDRYFGSDRTLGEAFLALTRLTAAIRCGHTYPNFYNQSDAVAQALFERRDKVPFEFRWIGGRMVVTEDRTPDGSLPRGTEVLAIDGVETERILRTLLPLARADGSNDGKRVAYLDVSGYDRYEAFDVLYPLAFPVRDTAFVLSVRRPGALSPAVARVTALTAEQRRSTRRVRANPESMAALWQYEEKRGVGVLTMPAWSLYNSKMDWKSWIDSLMTSVTERGLANLVLDIRGNEGGLDVGDAILAHLIDRPLSLPQYRQYVRYRSVPAEFRPILKTWNREFFDWGAAAEGPDSAGYYYRLRKWDADTTGARLVMPKGPRYRGRVWVLVGPVNSSATFQFANAVKRSGVATLVGRTTGGNLRGINGSAYFFVSLPRTGIEVDLPLVAMMSPREEPDAGVEPDIRVETTASHIARGIDPELEAVMAKVGVRRRTTGDGRRP